MKHDRVQRLNAKGTNGVSSGYAINMGRDSKGKYAVQAIHSNKLDDENIQNFIVELSTLGPTNLYINTA